MTKAGKKVAKYKEAKERFKYDRDNSYYEARVVENLESESFFNHWYNVCCFDFCNAVWREIREQNRDLKSENECIMLATREKAKVAKFLQLKLL